MLQSVRPDSIILHDLAPGTCRHDPEPPAQHPRDVQARLHNADDRDVVQLPQRIDQGVFAETRNEYAIKVLDRLVIRGGVFCQVAQAGFCAEDSVCDGLDGGGRGVRCGVASDFDVGGEGVGEGM